MAYSQIQQANEPLEHDIALSPRSIPHTLHDHVQENVRVSARQSHPDSLLIASAISRCRPLLSRYIQSAAGNNHRHPEGRLENIRPPVGENVALQERPQDPHYIDVVHYDMQVPVGYHYRPQLGVSITYLNDF
jgi:hypothetical protein